MLGGESGVSEKGSPGLLRCGGAAAGCGCSPLALGTAAVAGAAKGDLKAGDLKSFRLRPPNGRLVGRAGRPSSSWPGPAGGDLADAESRARETEAGRAVVGGGGLLPMLLGCAGGGDGAGAAADPAVDGGRGFCSAAVVGEVGDASFSLAAAAAAAAAERGL